MDKLREGYEKKIQQVQFDMKTLEKELQTRETVET
jgi:hypothetical protein